jgi:hypothetical protein
MVLRPLPPPLPPALQPMRSITPPPPLHCRGVCDGFFRLALTFAAKSMEHTANQLQQWAREPDLGVKSFANCRRRCHVHVVIVASPSRPFAVILQHTLLSSTSLPSLSPPFCMADCPALVACWPHLPCCPHSRRFDVAVVGSSLCRCRWSSPSA